MNDPYTYPDSNVLKNKLNIQDNSKLQKVETALSTVRIYQLEKNPVKGNFDLQHLKDIHKNIFQDVYDVAGKERTIGISKVEPKLNGDTVHYPHPDDPFPPNNLSERNKYAFNQLNKDNNLKGLN